MAVKDKRIKMMNEIINGIRILKLYAWEPAFIRSITSIREKELGYIRQKAVIGAISNILWSLSPILVIKTKRFLISTYSLHLCFLRLALLHLPLMFYYQIRIF